MRKPRRAFLAAIPMLPVLLRAQPDDPPVVEPEVVVEEGPPPPNVHAVSLKVTLALAPGIEAETSADVNVTGARNLSAAVEAARLTLRRGRLEVVGVRKW